MRILAKLLILLTVLSACDPIQETGDYNISFNENSTLQLTAPKDADTITNLELRPYFLDKLMGDEITYSVIPMTQENNNLVVRIEGMRDDICDVGRNRDLCSKYRIEKILVKYQTVDGVYSQTVRPGQT